MWCWRQSKRIHSCERFPLEPNSLAKARYGLKSSPYHYWTFSFRLLNLVRPTFTIDKGCYIIVHSSLFTRMVRQFSVYAVVWSEWQICSALTKFIMADRLYLPGWYDSPCVVMGQIQSSRHTLAKVEVDIDSWCVYVVLGVKCHQKVF